MPSPDRIAEGERLMTICNSCRYCEGFCDVFPAMERRLEFSESDINYLANLCHNCAECYYACQYAPPHEFAVNVPQVFAEIRAESYRKYAWPGYVRVSAWLAVVVGLIVVALLAGGRSAEGANFYGVIPHGVMVATFGIVAALIFTVYVMGLLRFWDAGRPTLGCTVPGGARCADSEEYGQPWGWLHLSGRTPLRGSAALSSLHVLWVSVVFRVDHGGGDLPLCGAHRAASLLESAGGVGDAGRRRAADRARRTLLAEAAARYGYRRYQTGRDGCFVSGAVVSDESHGAVAIGVARDCRRWECCCGFISGSCWDCF